MQLNFHSILFRYASLRYLLHRSTYKLCTYWSFAVFISTQNILLMETIEFVIFLLARDGQRPIGTVHFGSCWNFWYLISNPFSWMLLALLERVTRSLVEGSWPTGPKAKNCSTSWTVRQRKDLMRWWLKASALEYDHQGAGSSEK